MDLKLSVYFFSLLFCHISFELFFRLGFYCTSGTLLNPLLKTWRHFVNNFVMVFSFNFLCTVFWLCLCATCCFRISFEKYRIYAYNVYCTTSCTKCTCMERIEFLFVVLSSLCSKSFIMYDYQYLWPMSLKWHYMNV